MYVAIYDHDGPDSLGKTVRMLGGKTIVHDDHPAVAANRSAWAFCQDYRERMRHVSPGGTDAQRRAQHDADRAAADKSKRRSLRPSPRQTRAGVEADRLKRERLGGRAQLPAQTRRLP
jgi:hypothetical protein